METTMLVGRTRKLAGVALGATVLVLGGCGGGGGGGGGGGQLSKSQYKQKLHSVADEVKSLQSVGSSTGSATSKIDRLRTGFRKAADELGSVKPPNEAKADNAELVSGLRGLADALGPVEQALKNHDAKAEQGALVKFQSSTAVQKFQHALSDLKAKGYARNG